MSQHLDPYARYVVIYKGKAEGAYRTKDEAAQARALLAIKVSGVTVELDGETIIDTEGWG